MKRDNILLFQCLLSIGLIALVGWAGLGLFARLSQQSKVGPPASRSLVFADHAEWNQFYDAVGGVGRTAEVAQPADAVPENRAARDVVNGPSTTRMSADQAPSPSIAPEATTASPVVPPSELAVKTDAPSTQTAALPDRPDEKGVNSAVPNEPARNQEPRETAPSVAATESPPPAIANPPATAPVPALDANADKSTQRKTPPAAPPASTPRTKAAARVPPVRNAARVKQAAPEPEREPERSRPSIPSRARVALSRKRHAPQSDGPQWNGTQWVDPQHFGPPQHQSGALSYAPPEYNALPPGGPQFGPYFPYGSSPPSDATIPRATVPVAAAV